MPDKPTAEFQIDEALVRRLLVPAVGVRDAASLPLVKAAEGWDCEMWRLGDDRAARLPRREMAAPLLVHEQHALPVIGSALIGTGVIVPVPLFAGAPSEVFPHAWSLVPWIEGTAGIEVPRVQRGGWPERLAAALGALHVAAPADHPVNPVRGVPLALRASVVAERIAALRGAVTDEKLARAAQVWADGIAAEPWSGAPVWIHGDLHPGNLVDSGGELAGIVDFGDVTGGDPAYDLAVAWLAFTSVDRTRFISATGDRYDDATWVRARAWAVAVSAMLLRQSDDNPAYAGLGGEGLAEAIAS